MNLSAQSFVTVNEILADVLKVVRDEDFRLNSRGFYVSQIQQALEELSFDTYFEQRNEIADIPDDLRVPIPKGSFNLRQLYLFSGTRCNIGVNTKNVYHKRNFINGTSGQGYVARNTGPDQRDPFHNIHNQRKGVDNRPAAGDQDRVTDLFFYNVQNGMIMLSSSCRKFEKLFMTFNGVGCDVGDVPVVPIYLRQAVKDYVSNVGLETRLTDAIGDPSFNAWQVMAAKVEARLNKPFDGSWAKAEHRVKGLNSKDREDLKEYLSKADSANL